MYSCDFDNPVLTTCYKEQCKTKYSRLMCEYDVYKRVCNISGAGWNSEINGPTLGSDTWESLASSQPRNASILTRIREEGFLHSNVCSLITGDSRANAEEAANIASFLDTDASALLESADTEVDGDGHGTQATDVDESTGIQLNDEAARVNVTSTATFTSPTVAQRVERVKRFRDGRKKTPSRECVASEDAMASFFETAERYFQLKTQLLCRQLDE